MLLIKHCTPSDPSNDWRFWCPHRHILHDRCGYLHQRCLHTG